MYFLISFISGVLTALPLNFEGLYFLSWLSMIPLFWILYKKRPLFRYFLLFGIGYYGVSYHWFTELYPLDFAGLSKVTGAIAVAVCWIGLSLLQSVWIALSAPLMRLCAPLRAKCGRWIYPFYAAAVWTFIEWTMSLTWAGVPFFRLALTQADCLPMIQSASIFGSLFISFLIIFVNATLAVGFTTMKTEENRKEKQNAKAGALAALHAPRAKKLVPGEKTHAGKKRSSIRTMALSRNIYVIAAVLTVVVNYSFGLLRVAFSQSSDSTTRVAVIQGNISSLKKWNDYAAADSLKEYIELSKTAAEDCSPQIIVWPETVIPVDLTYYESYAAQIEQLAVDTGTMIFVGAFDGEASYDGEGIRKTAFYNAVYAFYPDGTAGELPYYKRKLVPFGEFMPMRSILPVLLPALADFNLVGDDLTAGTGTNIAVTSIGRIGNLICFDSVYDETTRDSVLDGAELLILSTNDSWYGDSTAITQHHNHSILRAIETGRYVVHAASTGISSIISPTGNISSSLEVNEQGYIYGDVEMKNGMTLFDTFGNIFVLFCAALILAGGVLFLIPHAQRMKEAPALLEKRKTGKITEMNEDLKKSEETKKNEKQE